MSRLLMYKAHSRISFLATFFAEDPHFYKDNRHHNSSTFVLSRAYHVQALTQCEKITDTHKSVSRGKKKFPSLSLSLSLSLHLFPKPIPSNCTDSHWELWTAAFSHNQYNSSDGAQPCASHLTHTKQDHQAASTFERGRIESCRTTATVKLPQPAAAPSSPAAAPVEIRKVVPGLHVCIHVYSCVCVCVCVCACVCVCVCDQATRRVTHTRLPHQRTERYHPKSCKKKRW